MSRHPDRPLYLTFEQFERDEIRRAESLGAGIEDLFDSTLEDPLAATFRASIDDADDEEE